MRGDGASAGHTVARLTFGGSRSDVVLIEARDGPTCNRPCLRHEENSAKRCGPDAEVFVETSTQHSPTVGEHQYVCDIGAARCDGAGAREVNSTD